MKFAALSSTAGASEYNAQAEDLLEAWQVGDSAALQFFRGHLPRLLDPEHPWVPRKLSDSEVEQLVFDLSDACEAVARAYDFASWEALNAFSAAMARKDHEVYGFECAVDAVVDGDLSALKSLIASDPNLVRARSKRVTHFDPPVHQATLLHYVAANGVEGYRQRTPANVVEIARALLEAGADPNSLAKLYGGECTAMSLLVSSSHPAQAGVQVALIDLLVSYGASVKPTGSGNWVSPVETALVFRFQEAAEALVGHGAALTAASAAGLGRVEELARLLPAATAAERQRALAIATVNGEVETARMLLDSGADPNAFNPPGTHGHTPPLHQAVWTGNAKLVRLLLERGARLDIRDTIYGGTPLDWARHGGQTEIAAILTAHGRQ